MNVEFLTATTPLHPTESIMAALPAAGPVFDTIIAGAVMRASP